MIKTLTEKKKKSFTSTCSPRQKGPFESELVLETSMEGEFSNDTTVTIMTLFNNNSRSFRV